jgi:hypothetical protein
MRVTESMGPAWETMKRILFRPFNIGTWFSFGFLFFLQSCMEGGGGGNNLRVPDMSRLKSLGRHTHDTGTSDNDIAGVAHHLWHGLFGHAADGSAFSDTGLIVMVAVIAVMVAVPIVILMYWLGTRGQMMAIRAVAMGQATTVGEQWNATRSAGGMLFKFQLAIAAMSCAVALPLLAGMVVVALPVIREEAELASILPAVLGIGVVLLLALLPLILIGSMARNFVAPIMLKHNVSAREGWKRFWAVGRNHVSGIIGFLVLRVAVGIGAAIVSIFAGLLTCCLGFLPVLHQTLMAPYYVFERAWTLEVLASMSPDFDLRGAGGAPPQAPPAGWYDGGGGGPANPYVATPGANPYAPPGYGGGGYGGPPPGGFGAP